MVLIGFPTVIPNAFPFVNGGYVDRAKNFWVPDANGEITVPDTSLQEFLDFWFVYPAPSTLAVGRPTLNLFPGLFVFDLVLNRPIWRNSANTGWVFSDGLAA
jgi:hypothetical protein